MLKTFTPRSAELRKFIDVFYIFNADRPGHFSYVAFPHTNTAISFLKGVSITRNHFHLTIQQNNDSTDHGCIEILGKYTRPVIVEYNGNFDEVAVVFKPMGINRFLPGPLLEWAPAYSQPLDNEKWAGFSEQLFRAKENRIERLEDFLRSQLIESDEFNRMDKAIKYFENSAVDYSVEKVAQTLAMTVKTFQRHFVKHLTCSPTEYKRIARFRNALKAKISSTEFKSLTSVSYDSNYSDQSYFIREFKKLTNQNPKKFFTEISVLDDEKIIWELK